MLDLHSRTVLQGRYTVGDETPEDIFRRVAKYYGSNPSHSKRLLQYFEDLWLIPASPILANGGTDRALPISCFLTYVPDSREGLASHFEEIMWMGLSGGGVGSHWSDVRSAGQKTSRGTVSTGALQFLHVDDSYTLACNQGSVRQAAHAAFLHVGHPEIFEFVSMRKPTGGDVHRKNLNMHHGLVITDAFMEAVEAGDEWALIDPHSKEVTQVVQARDLWSEILETRAQTGEPYLVFIDECNRNMHPDLKEQGLKINGSNLCVAPETKILTDMGWIQISDAAGKQMKVWNGQQFSKSRIEKTSDGAKLIKVEFSDGSTLECTEYHKFHTQTGYFRGTGLNKLGLHVVDAKDLKPGDKLQKCTYPVIEFTEELEDAYTQGFYTGDGSDNVKGSKHIDLYGVKLSVLPRLATSSVQSYQPEQDRTRVLVKPYEKYSVPFRYSIKSRLDWFAGLLDSDGCLCLNGKTPALQIHSVNLDFINDVRLMLQTLGVSSKVTNGQEAGRRLMPDGHGGSALFDCRESHRLLIGANGILQLLKLGMTTTRIQLEEHVPNRNAEQFVKVKKITDEGRYDATYCFNEPLQHKGIFNGVLAGNCVEITLPTNEDRTAVCCLSSVNLEKYDEWKNTPGFIEDAIEFLDNVLQDFINNAPLQLSKAVYSARQERSIGLGAMGFHSYLQSHMIPVGTPAAIGMNLQMFSYIKECSIRANEVLAVERGAAEGLKKDRFSHMLAIAPNASTAIIAGTSPSIEPWSTNIFVQKTVSGALTMKNKQLDIVLQEKAIELYPEDLLLPGGGVCVRTANRERDVREWWSQILNDGGSVQNLDCLDDWEKDVFKTAAEINQMHLIKLAADRQQFVCQSQSLNLFFPAEASRKYVNKVHLAAWRNKLKTLYYMRTIPIRTGRSVTFDTAAECESCSG
jgi:ribonucleotide reductase alpha subunit